MYRFNMMQMVLHHNVNGHFSGPKTSIWISFLDQPSQPDSKLSNLGTSIRSILLNYVGNVFLFYLRECALRRYPANISLWGCPFEQILFFSLILLRFLSIEILSIFMLVFFQLQLFKLWFMTHFIALVALLC